MPGGQQLRSSLTSALAVPSTWLWRPAFPVATGKTWNSLPSEVTSSKTFKTLNQTSKHTFSRVFLVGVTIVK